MQQKQKIKKIKLSSTHRCIILPLSILSILLFIIFALKMVHYLITPISALFQSPTLSQSPYIMPSYVYNFILYLSFFIQHIVMALTSFKIKINKLISSYPLYQRYIYNICSSSYYIIILSLVKPVSLQHTIIFQTPKYLNIVFTIIFNITFIKSIVKLGSQIHMPYTFKQMLYNQYVQFKGYKYIDNSQLVKNGLYGIVRHPMQSSALGLFIFASNIYTIDRLVFIVANLIGIMIGIFMQQKRLKQKFIGYQQYQHQVKWRLLPFIF